MTATTTTRARTARKVLGSLGIIGAAAAVAGMGTFGTFTDSTAPLNASVTSGTLSLDLNATNSTASLPMNVSSFVPGDSISRSVDLVNSGDLGFASIMMTSAVTPNTASSLLDSDKINGLQLTVKSCSGTWSESLAAGVATYTCNGTTTTLINPSAAVQSSLINNIASLNPRGVDHLVVTLSLPPAAGNDFQGKTSALSISFSGTQQTGTSR